MFLSWFLNSLKKYFFYYCKLHCIEISGLCKITSDISSSNIPNVLFRIVILGPVIGLSYYIDKTAEKNKILAKYLTSVVSQITTVHVHLAFLFKKKKITLVCANGNQIKWNCSRDKGSRHNQFIQFYNQYKSCRDYHTHEKVSLGEEHKMFFYIHN